MAEPSQQVILRSIEPSDWRDWWEIRRCPNVMRNTLGLPFASQADAQERLAKPPEGFYSVVAEVDAKMVGQCGLHVGRGRKRHVGSMGIMVHDDYVRRGIGAMMLRAMLDLAERWLGLTRLELEVFTDNVAAIHLYETFGFVIEGTKRCYALRDGEYADVYVMARVQP